MFSIAISNHFVTYCVCVLKRHLLASQFFHQNSKVKQLFTTLTLLTVLQGGDIVCAVFRLRQLHTELMPFALLCTNPWTPPDGLLIFAKSRMRKIEFGGHGNFLWHLKRPGIIQRCKKEFQISMSHKLDKRKKEKPTDERTN